MNKIRKCTNIDIVDKKIKGKSKTSSRCLVSDLGVSFGHDEIIQRNCKIIPESFAFILPTYLFIENVDRHLQLDTLILHFWITFSTSYSLNIFICEIFIWIDVDFSPLRVIPKYPKCIWDCCQARDLSIFINRKWFVIWFLFTVTKENTFVIEARFLFSFQWENERE